VVGQALRHELDTHKNTKYLQLMLPARITSINPSKSNQETLHMGS